MPTIQQVWQQINALPDRYVFYTRKEIRYLPKVLTEDERILALTSGYLNNRTWLCVCTNKRIVFLDRGMFWGLRQIQLNLDRIQAIDSKFGLIFGSIRVWDGASAFEIGMVPRSCVATFVRTVQSAMDQYKRQMVHDIVSSASAAPHATHMHVAAVVPAAHPQPTQPAGYRNEPSFASSAAPVAATTNGWVAELERLSQLRDGGHLSDAEYAAAKAKLLGNAN